MSKKSLFDRIREIAVKNLGKPDVLDLCVDPIDTGKLYLNEYVQRPEPSEFRDGPLDQNFKGFPFIPKGGPVPPLYGTLSGRASSKQPVNIQQLKSRDNESDETKQPQLSLTRVVGWEFPQGERPRRKLENLVYEVDEFQFSSFDPGSAGTVIRHASPGSLTVNEARARAGFKPLP